jgi:hypothetical protein
MRRGNEEDDVDDDRAPKSEADGTTDRADLPFDPYPFIVCTTSHNLK